MCHGVHLHLTDARAYEAVRVAVELMDLIRRMYPESFAFNPPAGEEGRPMIDLLAGGSELREGVPVDVLLDQWQRQSEAFALRARPYHLYQ